MPNTNGTANPSDPYNWESLAVTLLSVAGAVVANVWPGHSVPTAVQTTADGVAGLLTLAHVHVPKIVSGLFAKLFQGGTTITPAQADLLKAVESVVGSVK